MLIEKIISTKKGLNITVDGKEYENVNKDAAFSNGLFEGTEIDGKTLQKVLKESEKENAKAYLYGYLMKGSKTEKDCRDKLFEKKFSSFAVEYAIASAKNYGYVDDLAFAENYVASKSGIYGEYKIVFELKRKGVCEEYIEKAFSSVQPDSGQACLLLVRKYMKNKVLDTKTQQKLLSHFASRGFSYSDIKYAIDNYEEE